ALEELEQLRGHELGDLVHFIGVPVLLQGLEVVAGRFNEVLFIEPGWRIDDRTSGNRSGRTTEDRTHASRLLLEHFTLHRRAGWRQVLLLLATTSGDETEDQEGDDRHDQDVEDLHALEAAAHEHGGQQATGSDAGQRAEPARRTAGFGSGASGTGRAGSGSSATGSRRRSHLAGLVSRRSAGALAATKALGVGVEAHRQADA